MRASNFLANIFDFFGDALERFNPSAFRFLAASLPYLTPVPVAWLTAHSASKFLEFPPEIAFIFVFALEGLGLWFTTLLVDAVVDWVRSKNRQAFLPVVLFVVAVSAYVYLLVNLNVTLEIATGNVNPARSTVITLMCFLPLITGIGNGYYKLKLDYKTELESTRHHNEELELLKLQEGNKLKLEKFRIKYGSSGSNSGTSRTLPKLTSGTGRTSKTTSRTGRPSIHEQRVFDYMEQVYSESGRVATFKEVMDDLGLPQSTASRIRNEWLKGNGETK